MHDFESWASPPHVQKHFQALVKLNLASRHNLDADTHQLAPSSTCLIASNFLNNALKACTRGEPGGRTNQKGMDY
jgi:hypothetical protein